MVENVRHVVLIYPASNVRTQKILKTIDLRNLSHLVTAIEFGDGQALAIVVPARGTQGISKETGNSGKQHSFICFENTECFYRRAVIAQVESHEGHGR